MSDPQDDGVDVDVAVDVDVSQATDRLVRWRLLLGGGDGDGTGMQLQGLDAKRDAALEKLYSADDRRGGLGRSSPQVARWLGDIRTYFPAPVVQILQRDAVERLGLHELLLEPELLEAIQPDVHLVATLLALRDAIPERSRETARAVVRQVVQQLEDRLAQRIQQAVSGAIDRAARTRRPRGSDIDWNRTILANLRRYQPEHRTVIPEVLVGYGRRTAKVLRDVILCIDQSGSMASSVVHAGVVGAALASIRSVRTRLVVFDTDVADLSDHLHDPVELLFGVQLGGGTDINRALAYCEGLVQSPNDTVLLLVSDLFEGGHRDEMLARVTSLVGSGVTMVALLSLSDDGAPSFDHETAVALADLGVPAFACTPDQLPDLLAAAIDRHDVAAWAGAAGITVAAPPPSRSATVPVPSVPVATDDADV